MASEENPAAPKGKRAKKPRSVTNNENYKRRMARDVPIKAWLNPHAAEAFEACRKALGLSRSAYANLLFDPANPYSVPNIEAENRRKGVPATPKRTDAEPSAPQEFEAAQAQTIGAGSANSQEDPSPPKAPSRDQTSRPGLAGALWLLLGAAVLLAARAKASR